MSKSRPTYGPLCCDPTGRRHLLVLQFAAAENLETAGGFSDTAVGPTEIWAMDAYGAGTATHGAPLGDVDLADRLFHATPAMLEALRDRLVMETMGLRLYGLGDEAFLWDLFGVASEAGLGRHEVKLTRTGAVSRRVRCVHCSTMNEDVRTDLVVCRGCGLILAVRDHFSRRLAAFMGVHADAEAAGDLPEPTALAG